MNPQDPYHQPPAPYQLPPHPPQPQPPYPAQPGQPLTPSMPLVQDAPPPPARTQHPVSYDEQGRPVYAQAQPQLVYLAKPINPIEQEISPEIKALHEQSRRRYPHLNLSDGEYIISAIRRHPIGLLRIWGIALALIIAFMALFIAFFANQGGTTFGTDESSLANLGAIAIGFLTILAIGGAMAATYVYNNNRFFLTNESVIQEIQVTLFARREQTVSLANIEDASFKQDGIIASIFNFGTIRLSTEGDETTYRFAWVSNPKKQVAILNNAVEAFKNGRPVDPSRDHGEHRD